MNDIRVNETHRPGKRSIFTAYVDGKPLVAGCDRAQVIREASAMATLAKQWANRPAGDGVGQ